MKTLKLFSFLGLVILIGFLANCDKEISPHGSNPDPGNPVDNRIWEATVNYTGEPVVAITYKCEMTLNRVWTEEKLQDKDLGGWYYPKGRFVIIEAKIKNIEPNLNSGFSFTYKEFAMVDKYDNVYTPDAFMTGRCFYNPFGIYLLKYHEETPLSILVFDVPENATGLVLVFYDKHVINPTTIKFNLLTL